MSYLAGHEAELCTRLSRMGSPLKNGTVLPPANGSLEEDEVRTLFVSGLPLDVRPRELYLLFRTYEGYEGCFLKLISSKPGKQPQPIAFVSFRSRKQAEKALEELRGVRFDPASSQTLRLEFARTNSRVSPRQPQPSSSPSPMGQGFFQVPQLQKNDSCGLYMMPDGSVAQHSAPGMVGMTTSDSWSPRVQISVPFTSLTTPSHAPSFTYTSPSHPAHYPMFGSFSELESQPTPSPPPGLGSVLGQPCPPTPSSTPTPCSTLFVANLESHHAEEEIVALFSSFQGFVRAKMLSKGGPPVAFVEFKDIDCAREAMEKLQGFVLMTSKRGSGIRIEYAKQRMGEPSRSPSNDGSGASSPIQIISNGGTVVSPVLPPGSPSAAFAAGTSSDCSTSQLQFPPINGQNVPVSVQPPLLVNGLSSPIVYPSWPTSDLTPPN